MLTVETHVDIITEEAFEDLLTHKGNPCISLYMPTQRHAPEDQRNRINFKNLITDVRKQLTDRGFRAQEIDTLLADVQPLIDDNVDDWQYMNDGFAVFIAPDFYQSYRLPRSFESFSYIGDKFHISQLLPIITNDQEFYVLELDLERSRLIKADRYRLAEVELTDVPTSVSEALQYDDFERQVQLHSTANQGKSDQNALFHGQGTAADEDRQRENNMRFLQALDNGICSHLNTEHKPLILAGGDSLRGLYRQVNHYDHVLEKSIDNDTESLSDEELHARAWDIVKSSLGKQLAASMNEYKRLSGNNDERATNDFERIVPAAHFQRVDTLFIAEDRNQWGEFDQENNQLIVHDQRHDSDSDLINDAVVHTLKNGGGVYTVNPDDIANEEQPMAAILRY